MAHYYKVPTVKTPPKPRKPLSPLVKNTPRDFKKGYAKNRRGSPKTPPNPPTKHTHGHRMVVAALAKS